VAETKYGKYIIKAPIEKSEGDSYPVLNFMGEKPWSDWRDIKYSMAYAYITEPVVLIPESHKHDYEQFLFFLGGDPMDIGNFGAEIEMVFGKEGEKHIINTASVVRIPPGLYHCPLNFKRIDKPLVFLDVCLAPEYAKQV